MSKLFSKNLRRLRHKSKLSPRYIHIKLLHRGIYAEVSKIKSWLDGKVPEERILRALAGIFTEVLKREVTVDELLGEESERIKLELGRDLEGREIIVMQKGKMRIGSIYPKRSGIKIVSKYFQDRDTVFRRIKFSAATRPPEIFIDILGGGEK